MTNFFAKRFRSNYSVYISYSNVVQVSKFQSNTRITMCFEQKFYPPLKLSSSKFNLTELGLIGTLTDTCNLLLVHV